MTGWRARWRGLSVRPNRGAFLDITLDYAFYALIPLKFAVHDSTGSGLPTTVLIASFVTCSSFLDFATIAERRGLSADDSWGQGHLLPRWADRTLRNHRGNRGNVSVFQRFPKLSGLFAAAFALTTVLRWHQG